MFDVAAMSGTDDDYAKGNFDCWWWHWHDVDSSAVFAPGVHAVLRYSTSVLYSAPFAMHCLVVINYVITCCYMSSLTSSLMLMWTVSKSYSQSWLCCVPLYSSAILPHLQLGFSYKYWACHHWCHHFYLLAISLIIDVTTDNEVNRAE